MEAVGATPDRVVLSHPLTAHQTFQGAATQLFY